MLGRKWPFDSFEGVGAELSMLEWDVVKEGEGRGGRRGMGAQASQAVVRSPEFTCAVLRSHGVFCAGKGCRLMELEKLMGLLWREWWW